MSKLVYYKDLLGGNDKQHITSEETDKDEDIQKELESQTRALNNMIHTVNASVEELSRKTEIEISDDILQRAIDKLKARYPDGFSVEQSLHRKDGDI